VVDAFPDDAGRQFHLDAGMTRVTNDTYLDMLAVPPSFTRTDIVASKLPAQTLVSTVDGSPDPRLEQNKQTVLAFYEAGVNNKDFAAASAFLGGRYVQHNPLIADGVDGMQPIPQDAANQNGMF
jgi:hypothetical protein